MDSMHIAMVGQRGVPATYGGIERHVEELGALLVERGHKVTVFARHGYTDSAITKHRGIDVVTLPTIGTRHLDASVGSAFATFRATIGDADIVHFHALGPGVFSLAPRLMPGKKVVQTIHGLDHQRQKWGGFASACLRGAAWLSAHVPDRRVVVSRALEEHYAALGVQAAYVPNGVTPMGLLPRGEALDRLGVGNDPYLLFVGRLVPEKRPDYLIETFKKLDGDHRLLIVGGSSHSDEYVADLTAKAGLDDRVVLPGYLYGDDLREVYTNASGFVLPSKLEGLPLTLLDAMGAGLPILASDIMPHRELVPQDTSTARLFGVDDGADFEAGLKWLMSGDQAVANSSDHANFLDRYSWERAADDLEAVYCEVLGRERTTISVP